MTTKHLMRTLFLSLCGLLLWTMPAQAATIFSENYEVTAGNVRTGTQTGTDLEAKGWTITCQNPNPCTMDVVTSPVVGGAKSLRLTYIDGTADNLNMHITKTFTGVEEVWDTFWLRHEKIDSGQPLIRVSSTISSMKHHYWNSGGADPISVFFGFNFSGQAASNLAFTVQRNFTVPLCPSGSTNSVTCIYPPNLSGATFPTNQWVCVEAHMKMNTVGSANGLLDVWLDGTKTLQYTNIVFRDAGTASSTFKKFIVYRQSAKNVYRFEDDLTVSTTRIGCGGAPPPPSDTTAPATPTGLAVQ